MCIFFYCCHLTLCLILLLGPGISSSTGQFSGGKISIRPKVVVTNTMTGVVSTPGKLATTIRPMAPNLQAELQGKTSKWPETFELMDFLADKTQREGCYRISLHWLFCPQKCLESNMIL